MKLKGLWNVFLQNSELFAGAAVTFASRAIAAAAGFAMNVVVARVLGVSEAGVFFLAITSILAASVVSRSGMDVALIKFISPAWEKKDYSKVLGVSLQGVTVVLVAGSVVSVAMYLCTGILAHHVFMDDRLVNVLHILAISIVPFSLLLVFSGILKAMRRPAQANFVEAGITPVLFICLTVVGLMAGVGISLQSVSYSYLLSTITGVCLAIAVVTWRFRNGIKKIDLMPVSELASSAYPLMLVALMNFIIMWVSSVVLGALVDASAVAMYNVAHRTAFLVAFVLIVFNSISAPIFAVLYKDGKFVELEDVALKTTYVMLIVSLPVVGCFIIAPGWVLSIFGKEYISASALLVILSIGQLINVMTGSVGYLLMMCGSERILRNILIFITILSLLLNFVFINAYGVIGAAVATAMCSIAQNLVSAWFVYKRIGIRVIPVWNKLRNGF